MRKVRNQKGFTIMELMIVIVIIGILIAIAVPAYNSFRARAELTQCEANRRTIKSGWGLAVADGYIPAALADNAAIAGVLVPAYMDAVPTCRAGGSYSITDAGLVNCDEHAGGV